VARAFDVAVVGAGSFGAWTAEHLRRAGLRVALVDAYGPAHNRSSSGGESRLIRIGYGQDALYSRFALASLREWRALARRVGEPLFHPTGILWLGHGRDAYAAATLRALRDLRVPHERLTRAELRRRYPQARFPGASFGILETQTGVLMARRAVQALVRESVAQGLEYRQAAVLPPVVRGRRLVSLELADGGRLRAERYVFACGAWLPKLFPELLRGRIVATRQEVCFFGVPAGDSRFAAQSLPAWIDFAAGVYGLPDVEGRGLKLAIDTHGPRIDPDTADRTAAPGQVRAMRRLLATRFPDLARAPLVETRVCQYENTSNGDLLIDRHPRAENVWLVGGGSGHGFKHGPAVGAYVAKRLTRGGRAEPRFSLETKLRARRRAVF
jgi:monomeric sarcosine oxidase